MSITTVAQGIIERHAVVAAADPQLGITIEPADTCERATTETFAAEATTFLGFKLRLRAT